MTMLHDIYFVTATEERKIGSCNDTAGGYKIIKDFLDSRNYKSYYQRYHITEDNCLWVDVGSYSEFFKVTNVNSIEEVF